MAENLERASPAQRRALVELVAQRVTIADRTIRNIVWADAARGFLRGAPAEEDATPGRPSCVG